MPQINEKVMIEVLLSAEQAVRNLKKVSDAISGIGEQTNRQTETAARKQEETAEKTAKIQQTAARKTSSVIGKEMGTLLKGMFTLGAIIKGIQIFNHFAAMGADIRYMANAAGMAEGKFEKLGNAARKMGGSYASTGSTVRNLTLMLERLKFEAGGPLVEAARQYGLQFTKNGLPMTTEELMRSIARTMGNLKERGDKSAQINLANILGIDDATFRMMQDGEAMYLRRIQEAAATDARAKRESERYVQAVNEFKTAIDKFGMQTVPLILPVITDLVTVLNKMINALPDFFKETTSYTEGVMADTGEFAPDTAPKAVSDLETYKIMFNGFKEFMRPFVKAAGATPMIIPAGAGVGRGAIGTVTVNQTFNGRTDPAQVARASEQGISTAISRSGLGLSAAAQLGANK